jgi:hypothetical protein
MRYFHIKPPDVTGGGADGLYEQRLPAIRCPTCNRYKAALNGINVTFPAGINREEYKLRDPVLMEDFEILADPLRSLVSRGDQLLPGTGLGEFRGTIANPKEKRDFLWVSAFRLLPKETAYQKLLERGINIPFGPSVMTDIKTSEVRPDYRRIFEVPVVKCMAIQSLEFAEFKNCRTCGLSIARRPSQLFLKRRFIPGFPLFALEETDQILANDAFKDAVLDLKLSGIKFKPAEVC